MRTLILGGTEFVGRAFVEEALARGWEVTTFNRQTHRAPSSVRSLRGNRWEADGLAELASGEWDVVVDTWSWAPSAVRDAAQLLASRADHYVYVSSRSVYTFPTASGADETAPLVESSPDLTEAEYAESKAGGELAVTAAFGDRAILLRAGLIIGPHENIGRLPWWLQRTARGGDVLAPGTPGAGIQYIDARDLARFGLDAAATGHTGPFNIVSPVGFATLGDLLAACVEVTNSDAVLRWVPAETVLAAGIEPWSQLPVWLPEGELHETLHEGDVSRALAAGLTVRPLRDTVADTWAWLQEVGEAPQRPDRPRLGLDPGVEARVLAENA